MMVDTLRERLHRYGAQAERVEQWKIRHSEAMACRELEDLLKQGLQVLEQIRQENQAWASAIQCGELEFSWEDSEQLAQLYRFWQHAGAALQRIIADFEARGFSVEGAEEFRAASREVSLMSLDVERVRDNVGALEAGRGISLDQAMYVLRSSLR